MVDAKAKVALVTGANKGIGFAIAQKLARLRMTVLIAARDPSKREQAAARIREEGLDAQYRGAEVGRGCGASIVRHGLYVKAGPRRVMDTIARTGVRPQWLAA